MRGILFVALVLFVVSTAFAQDESRGPGLSIAANTTFFRKSIDIVVPIVISALKGLVLHDERTMNLTLFNFTYALRTLQINDIFLDHTHTHVDIENGAMEVNTSDFILDCFGDLSFWTSPAIFYGNGTGKVCMTHLNSSVTVSFSKGKNNLPQLHLLNSHFDLNEQHVKANFEGNNDVFTLLEMAKNFTIPMLVEFLNGTMSKETREAVEETINGVLGELPSAITIPGTHIVFDFGLLFDPKVENGHVPMAIDGTAKCANQTACRHYSGPKPKLPPKTDVFGGNGSLQILLSDYIFNSLSIAAFEDSLFNFTVTPEAVHNMTNGTVELNTDLFGIFIPEMREVYGPGRNVSLELNMTAPPLISISPSEITMNTATWTSIYVNNSDNAIIKAFDIELFTEFKVNVRIADNTLKGNISDYKFSLELKYKDIQNVTLEELNSLFNTLLKVAIPQINNHLNEGIPLPPIPLFNLSNSELTLLPQYIRVDFNPEPIKSQMLALNLEGLAERLVQAYKKVRGVKLVEAKRPANLPEWLKVEF